MPRWLRRTLAAGLVMLALAGAFALIAWKSVERRIIAATMDSPQFSMHPQPAADFVFETLDGKQKHLSDFKGKVIFLNFWGTWCMPCMAEMPGVESLYRHVGRDPDVQFLAISRHNSPGAVWRYAELHRFSLPFYVSRDDDIPASMHLNEIPSTFVYSKDGKMVYSYIGAADWSRPEAVAFIESLRKQ
jgi:thiol-disulfide isomerase/thioredoxin